MHIIKNIDIDIEYRFVIKFINRKISQSKRKKKQMKTEKGNHRKK